MRRHPLLRSLVLAGAAFTLVAAGTAASVTLLSDRVAIRWVGGDSKSAPEHLGGPSVFEQEARPQQYPRQISAGPSTFEQQIRSQVPSPAPISRRPGF